MKNINFAFLIILCCTILPGCKKWFEGTNYNELPPITTSGKNTFGCKVNGQVWVPKGYLGTPGLAFDLDYGINDGTFNIAAVRRESSNQESGIAVSGDGLNTLTYPTTVSLSSKSLFLLKYFMVRPDYCETNTKDSLVFVDGKITITKLDKVNRIFAGTFQAKLRSNECGPIDITDGMFDISF